MRLWLLKADDDPDSPFYKISFDIHAGFVVRAESGNDARRIADDSIENDEEKGLWLDAACSSCELLTDEGEAGIILRDYYEG